MKKRRSGEKHIVGILKEAATLCGGLDFRIHEKVAICLVTPIPYTRASGRSKSVWQPSAWSLNGLLLAWLGGLVHAHYAYDPSLQGLGQVVDYGLLARLEGRLRVQKCRYDFVDALAHHSQSSQFTCLDFYYPWQTTRRSSVANEAR